jgi:hypothetical protein
MAHTMGGIVGTITMQAKVPACPGFHRAVCTGQLPAYLSTPVTKLLPVASVLFITAAGL